jgi:Deacetylase PdaC/Protein of unknown function (DUF3298)
MFILRSMLVLTSLCLLLACNNETPKAPAAELRVTEQAVKLNKCVRDSNCVEVNFELPQLEGGANAAAIKAINDSLKASVVSSNYLQYTLQQAADSTVAQLFTDLKMQLGDMNDPTSTMGFSEDAKGKIVHTTPKVVTAEFTYSSYTGGAHGMYGTTVTTYDLNTGKAYRLTDLVSDTTALRPLLEAKILAQKRSEDPSITALKDIVFEPEQPLALPVNFAVVKEGLRFIYNPYEIMAYAFGMSDVTLTWDELGKIADRTKW